MIYSYEQICDITEKYGSPFYVFDESGFIDNYNTLKNAFRSIYENYQIAYSFKTNYTPYIAKLVYRLGGYAEVVSGMEYEIAKKIGYPDDKIIFNGPNKGEAGLQAFLLQSIVNADSLDELTKLCTVAKDYPERQFNIGLRVNLDIGQDFISRFGIDDQDLPLAFEMVDKTDNVQINGIQCHISRCRGLEAWKKRAEKMLWVALKYFKAPPAYIDLGSGMFGTMEPEFAAQFNNVPTYEEYAAVVASLFSDQYCAKNEKPMLITEPGTTLINRFVDCYSKIESIKTIRGKSFAVLDSSIHTLGETCTLKQLPLQVVPCGAASEMYKDVDFTGYTCLEQDVMRSNYHGKLAVGDYVRFGNVGGYSNVLKPPFIRPNCAMLVQKPDGTIAVIKHAESFVDILNTYIF